MSRENLNKKWDEIKKSAQDKKQELILGAIPESNAIQIILSEKETTCINTFFTKANELNAIAVVADLCRLEQLDLDQEIEKLEDADEDSEPSESDLERLAELKKLSKEIDSITKITLSFVTPTNVIFILELGSSLHEFVFENDEEGDDDDDFFDEDGNDEVELPEPTEEEVEQATEKLVNDAKFQAATTNPKRLTVANLMFQVEFKKYGRAWPFHQILDEAKYKFDTEIKPKQEQELMSKIEKLKEQGLSKKDIAKELNVLMSIVSKYY